MRTRLDEIVDEGIMEARAAGWTGLTVVEDVGRRIAEAAFRHGVEQRNGACGCNAGSSGRVQPAPADDGIKRCVHGQALHCDKGCYKDRRKAERRRHMEWHRDRAYWWRPAAMDQGVSAGDRRSGVERRTPKG